MAAADAWARFRRWRRARPFWGGLLLILSAFTLFFSANLTLADIKVHFGMEGYLSYVLPAIMLLCGMLVWVTPGQRLFYAIIGLLTALYSLIGLNLGGFGAGMLLGIVGGALVFAWTPAEQAPPEPVHPETPRTAPKSDDVGTQILEPPPFADPAAPPEPGDARGTHRKLLAITLVPLAVSAAVLVAGHSPARAEDECPKGVPSRSTSATPSPSPEPSKSKNKSKTTKEPPVAPEKPGTTTTKPSDEDDDGTGNPIVDGWNDFVEGVGDLLGIGDEESPGPSTSPSPAPSGPAPDKPEPPAPGRPAPATTTPPAEAEREKNDDVPCLGPRVLGKKATGDAPGVSIQPGIMEGDKLTMYESTYDGVTELDTPDGPKRVLKFSMDKSVTTPFSLAIPERGGRTTLIRSSELTTTGDVRFYTSKFEGKLFGLIPVTFTPDQPPPLTLPVLVFTDIRIELAFVRCDELTAKTFKLAELS